MMRSASGERAKAFVAAAIRFHEPLAKDVLATAAAGPTEGSGAADAPRSSP